jgi:Domain of unknown function (DUF4174)
MLLKSLCLLLSLAVAGCSVETSASTTKVTSVITSAQTVSLISQKTMNLNSYQWKNRLLLVFVPSKNNAKYQQQMRLWQGQKAGFDERNLLVIDVLPGISIDNEEVAKVRKQFNVNPEEFLVVLVGKDGTAKRRDNSPVSPQAIFETIDAMPMRQQEMRQGLN